MARQMFIPAGKRRVLLPAMVYAILVSLTSVALIIFSAYFTSTPGPQTYYSHFSGLFFAVSLAFETFQLLLLILQARGPLLRLPRSRKRFTVFSSLYWGILTLSGVACTIAYGFPDQKADCIAIQVLICLTGIVRIVVLSRILKEAPSNAELSLVPPEEVDGRTKSSKAGSLEPAVFGIEFLCPPPNLSVFSRSDNNRAKTYLIGAGKYLNRFLRTIHAIISLLFVAGGIMLAVMYQYQNPGVVVNGSLPGGELLSVNYLCIASNTTAPEQPTIWFQSDVSHGTVDLLGMQTILSETYGRNSCSYDQPGFGWSSQLPASQTSFDVAFPPLLEAIGRQDEPRVMAAWGAGAISALKWSIQAPDVTRGLVLMDSYPDGVQYLWEQQANNWTTEQMLAYRQTDLQGSLGITKLVLMLAIPWGIIPAFIPSNPYFDPALASRYRAQACKEDFWADQYFSILQEIGGPIYEYLVTATVPPSVPTYAIMTNNSQPDPASNAFFCQAKVGMAEYIAGGNLSRPVVWCDDPDCSQNFPLTKAAWAAAALDGLLS